jgi:hypothetical protein
MKPYYDTAMVTAVKSFIVQAPGDLEREKSFVEKSSVTVTVFVFIFFPRGCSSVRPKEVPFPSLDRMVLNFLI